MTDDEVEPVPLLPMTFEPMADPILPTTGSYEVLTESGSRYLLQLDLELLTRVRGTEQPADPEVAYPSRLRRDGDTIRLLRLIQLSIGKPMIVDVEALGDPATVAFTRRTTTIVTEIRTDGADPEEQDGAGT
ncbi:hypothetical protein [Leifsonia sp. NPDC058230]|uniref:hypothetical protein n=1 Tax=Leifsonia sp. NPDC058230 TaxID=3346391 RepID=UPI0036DB26CC